MMELSFSDVFTFFYFIIKKETLAQVFFCEFCKFSKNTFLTEFLWVSASDF